MKKISNEAELKNALKIKDLSEIEVNEKKMNEFVKLMPNLEAEVAMSVIEQFANYQEACMLMARMMNSTCERVMNGNESSRKDAAKSYSATLDELCNRFQDPDLSEKERKNTIKQMIAVSDKVAELDKDNKKFLLKIFKYSLIGIAALLFFPIAALVAIGYFISKVRR